MDLQYIKSEIYNMRTLSELAYELGVSDHILRKFIKSISVNLYEELALKSRDNTYMRRTKDRLEKLNIDLYELCEEGYSFNSIYDNLKVSPKGLTKYVKSLDSLLYERFIKNGVNNKGKSKLSKDDLSTMLDLSLKGYGIDQIGKQLGVHGTTVRINLIKLLGEETYSERHSVTKYTENNGWNGKRIEYNGNFYQSNGEIEVAKILEKLNLNSELHKSLILNEQLYYPDFYIPKLNLYIEYVGMLDVAFYRKKFIQKCNDYMFNGIKFILVNSDTINTLEDTLRRYS